MSGFRIIHIIGILLGAASVQSTPALAQSSAADVQARIDTLDAKVRELERQLAAARTGHDGAQATIVLPPVAAIGAVPVSSPADSPVPANAAPATATPAPDALDALEAQIEQLDQQIRIVSRQLEIDREQATERAKTAPIVGAGREGFAMRSADGAFQLRLRGYMQSDGRFYADDAPARSADTFLLRRVRPILEGTLFKNVDFKLMPDFGGGTTVLQDAYIDLRLTPAAKIRAGKFKTPFGLERLASATDLLFVERALPTAVAPNRDAGVLLFGDLLNATLNYSVGVMNGVLDGGSGDADDGDGKDAVARVFALPFKASRHERLRGVGIGVAATTGTQRGTLSAPNLPAYRTNGQITFARYRVDLTAAGTTVADGSRWRVSPQGYFYTGPFGVLAEYAFSSQRVRREIETARLGTRAWQVATSYVLTGEDSTYRGVTPRGAFDPSAGSWGAVEVTARLNGLMLDEEAFPIFANPAIAARDARGWAVGANWYLNRAVKVTADYEETYFRGGAASGDRETERDLFTRIQLGF
jgi:phosphate-selective porin OprO and OprP